jgi:hypothetical protein
MLHDIRVDRLTPPFQATLAATRTLESYYSPKKVRLIYWLDN